MWTTALYEWDGKEFAEVSWPRDVIRKRFEEEQAAQLKALVYRGKEGAGCLQFLGNVTAARIDTRAEKCEVER